MDNAREFSGLPLRQRKYAQTKLGLLEATLRALETRSLDEVPVKELCDAVAISEASFFNYFPKKTDVLVYYVQLWSLEMSWHAKRLRESVGGLAAIEEIFALTGRKVDEQPGAMGEIIAWQARMTEPPKFVEITLAERLLAFPGLQGIADESAGSGKLQTGSPAIESTQVEGLGTLLPPLIAQAVASGELPADTDRAKVLVGLAGLFFGIPVVLRGAEPGGVEDAYRAQLHVYLTGLKRR